MIKIKAPNFNLQYTLECGQFFHYTKLNNIEYLVIIKDNAIKIKQQDDILYINKLSNISNLGNANIPFSISYPRFDDSRFTDICTFLIELKLDKINEKIHSVIS